MYKKPPSFTNGPFFSGLLARTALLQWIREFIDKSNIQGSYWEFGVFNGESMKEAYYILRDQPNSYIGFDSFEGLPSLRKIDEEGLEYMPHFVLGNFPSLGFEFVKKNILSTGLPEEKLFLYKGFFEDTLNIDNYKHLFSDETFPAVVHIDVDLYESTKLVLEFIHPFLRTGCWILFDDYWCYAGASSFGTQRAIHEYLNTHEDIILQEYCSYRGWSKAFIVERITNE